MTLTFLTNVGIIRTNHTPLRRTRYTNFIPIRPIPTITSFTLIVMILTIVTITIKTSNTFSIISTTISSLTTPTIWPICCALKAVWVLTFNTLPTSKSVLYFTPLTNSIIFVTGHAVRFLTSWTSILDEIHTKSLIAYTFAWLKFKRIQTIITPNIRITRSTSSKTSFTLSITHFVRTWHTCFTFCCVLTLWTEVCSSYTRWWGEF